MISTVTKTIRPEGQGQSSLMRPNSTTWDLKPGQLISQTCSLTAVLSYTAKSWVPKFQVDFFLQMVNKSFCCDEINSHTIFFLLLKGQTFLIHYSLWKCRLNAQKKKKTKTKQREQKNLKIVDIPVKVPYCLNR